jgi:DNA-binding XRE family transcriptional regulator
MFRKSKRMSQRQLGLALGITTRAVKYIEAGAREPRWTTQEAFDRLVERHQREALNG